MKILIPLDQSTRDGIVLRYCSRMAKELRARIAIVSVVSVTRALKPGAMRHTEAYIEAVEAGLREQELAVEGLVQRGDPASVVVALADELDVDMIVMATRARGSLGKLVLGSVADAVLTSCQKPVLLLSEATENGRVDEKTRLQSAYLATIVWHRQIKGIYTAAEAESQLGRLAAMGLARRVLFETYEAQQKRGSTVPWLDVDFQLNTLAAFLPEALPEAGRGSGPTFSAERAA